MPGVDFERIRAVVTMEQVLNLLGFEPLSRSGPQWYGSCPLPDCGSGRRRRSFSVNVASGRYCCHRCRSQGNALELWAVATQQSVYQAGIDLCRRLGCEIPWLRRW
jgi:CHC2-type zinc finger protein